MKAHLSNTVDVWSEVTCVTAAFPTHHLWFSFQDDAEFKKARGAELEYESLKVS